MESTKELLARSKALKEKFRKERNLRKQEIRKNIEPNKSVLQNSRERREIRQAKLKQIKDEMGLNLLPVAPSIINKSKNMIKKGLSSSEKDELDNLKNKGDLTNEENDRFNELVEQKSQGISDEMDEMRNNLEQMRDSLNQARQDRIDLRQNEEDSINTNDDPKPQRTQPEESNENPVEDLNESEPIDKISDDDILESTANKLSEGGKIGEDVEDIGKVAKDVSAVGDSVIAGGGEIDPIQDIIGGLIAVGGAISSAVSVEEKKARPQAMPIIQQQQTLQGTQI